MDGENGIIRVFVVAQSPIARAGLETVARQERTGENLTIAGSAAEISAAPFAVSPIREFEVLFVIVERQNEFDRLADFLRGGGDGGSRNEENFSVLPSVVALLAPEFQNRRQILELLRGGLRDILPSSAEREEIAAAIAAANNLTVVEPELLELVFADGTSENFPSNEENDFSGGDELVESLTAREREVLEMLAEGASNKRIADSLGISEHTVKFHVASVFGKLGVNSRTEAVTQALRRGLVLL